MIQQLAHVPAQFFPNQVSLQYQLAYQQMMQQQPEGLHDICVWNIDRNVTRDMLREMFRRYPSVREVQIKNDPGRGQKHGFVSFADESEKWRAIQEMNGAMLLKKPMHLRSEAHRNI